MKRTGLFAVLLLIAAACSPAEAESTTTTDAGVTTTEAPATTSTTTAPTTTVGDGFPVTVTDDAGSVTIDERPESIISLSAVATEMLFEVGAGDQVVAVDDQSNYPSTAPMTDLSGFTPNLEAILSYEPDLVFITFDPGDLTAGLEAAGVPVILFDAAATLEDVYRQIDVIGRATGNLEDARTANEAIRSDLDDVVAGSGDLGEGVTYYHEIDSNLYTVTSSTFFGEIYGLFGMVNIADPADEDGSAFGYPQLASEFVVARDPDIVFLANTAYGASAETVAQRPGWDAMSAIQNGRIVELDSDIASRWGPRIVDFARSIAEALEQHAPLGGGTG
jgi:iron complex transport system substrate-binding protein